MAETYLVVGGGFQGIMSAYWLASQGKKVTLMEKSDALGGVLQSLAWKGFFLDKGCHLFDNSSDLTTSILLEIQKDNVEPVVVRYASIFNRIKTDGIAIPDLSTLDPQETFHLLYHVLDNAANQTPQLMANLEDCLVARYGEIASRYLRRAALKMYQIEPRLLEADTLPLTPFQRIKFASQDISRLLKTIPVLDQRIALPSQADPMKFYRDQATIYPYRNFYPNNHGLSGFCDQAYHSLEALGVTILTECDIRALELCDTSIKTHYAGHEELITDYMIWTAGPTSLARLIMPDLKISQYVHKVPMVLCYFSFEKKHEGHYTYIQNFDDDDLYFRVSFPGLYGKNNCPPGYSYLCCEIPTHFSSPEWKKPESCVDRVWAELRRDQLISVDRPHDTYVVKTPVSYKLPKVGYFDALQELTDYIQPFPILGLTQGTFSKTQILEAIQSELQVG